LEALELYYTQVGDKGVQHLSSLPRLRRLELYGSLVGDRGARALGRIDTLDELELGGTAVSPEARARLRQLRPAMRIYDLAPF